MWFEVENEMKEDFFFINIINIIVIIIIMNNDDGRKDGKNVLNKIAKCMAILFLISEKEIQNSRLPQRRRRGWVSFRLPV
jgi:hypothetical protein